MKIFKLNSKQWLQFLKAINEKPKVNKRLKALLNKKAPWE